MIEKFKNYLFILKRTNNISRYLLPPIIYRSFVILRNSWIPFYEERQRKRQLLNTVLFDGNDDIFKKEIGKIKVYGEIGCGQSTCFAANAANIEVIYSVDNSQEWINYVKDAVMSKKVNLIHIDLGVLGEWGRPKGYEKIENLDHYALSLINQKHKPELILIDGRFRVFCFLRIITSCDYDLKIIFDDYLEERAYYKIVEKIIVPSFTNGRQALFEINEDFRKSGGIENATKMIESFRFVMD